MTTKKTNAKAGKDKSEQRPSSAGKTAAAKMAAEHAANVDSRGGKDRRTRDRRQKDVPVVVERRQMERRAKVNRRRQIDPTTCERDYTSDEIEFMAALDAYKRRSGRMFPTCSEVLEVIRGLGYEKRMTAPVAVVPELPMLPATAETAV